MAYCTLADVRAEGVLEDDYADPRVGEMIVLAKTYIDRVTELVFERALLTRTLSGNGERLLELPLPICQGDDQIVSLVFGRDYPETFDLDEVILYNEGREVEWPRLELDHGYVFPSGRKNIELSAYMGRVDYNSALVGDARWTTPLEIKRVAIRLVVRELPALGDADAQLERQTFRTTSERTRFRTLTLGTLAATGGPTGDPDIDSILAAYRRVPLGGII